jgi:rSAM/selenodomain-associated transferase 2
LGAVVVACEPGRGRQMNAGAAVTTGEFLLFLHADTLPPVDYQKLIRQTLEQPGVVAGAFQLRIDAPNRLLRAIEWFVNLRSRWLSLPYGDQGLFMRADTFRDMGGYADIPAMEDYELVRRLAKRGRIRLAPASVRTSARRWLHQGVVCATMVNQACIIGYHLGVNPCRLAAWRDGRCTHSRDTDRRGQDADSTHGRGGIDRQGSV